MSDPHLPPLDNLVEQLLNAVDDEVRKFLAASGSSSGIIFVAAFMLLRAIEINPKEATILVNRVARNMIRETETK